MLAGRLSAGANHTRQRDVTGDRIREHILLHGLREGATVVESLEDELAPELSMESTEDDILRRIQVRSSLAAVLESVRMEVVEGPVREHFG